MPSPSYDARSRVAISVLATIVCLALTAGSAMAAGKGGKGTGTGSTGSGLSLTSETTQNSPNSAAPLWCLNEDDYHKRTWNGSLNGGFTATERLCGTDADYSDGMYWNAGGVGLQSDIWVNGTLDDATITSPAGDSHHAVLVGTTTSKGATTRHYQLCYTPMYSMSSGGSGRPLPGGTWQITASGNFTQATLAATAMMTSVWFQQQNCPASEQNLTS